MTSQELGIIKSVLVSSKVIDATASDGDVAAAHAAALASPNSAEYRAALAAQGVQTGPNWLTIIGIAGGLVAAYMIWKHYQKDQVDSMEYPEPRDTRLHLRGVRNALSALRGRSARCRGPRRMGDAEKYEFEPETRLEGYHRRKARRK